MLKAPLLKLTWPATEQTLADNQGHASVSKRRHTLNLLIERRAFQCDPA